MSLPGLIIFVGPKSRAYAENFGAANIDTQEQYYYF